jgi:hypothetical protein
LQENNHIVVANKNGVIGHFSAGSVDLEGIDATDEQSALIFNESQVGRLREPDAVQWIDDTHFAIANEGDMDGGSRGWSIFNQDGDLIYENGTAFERAIIEVGHYPARRELKRTFAAAYCAPPSCARSTMCNANSVAGGPTISKKTVVVMVSAIMVAPHSGNVSAATSAMPTATPACGRRAGP